MILAIARWFILAIPLLAVVMRGSVSIEAQMVLTLLVAVLFSSVALANSPRPRLSWLLNRTALLVTVLSVYILMQALLPAWSAYSRSVWEAAQTVSGKEIGSISLAPADTIASIVAVTSPILLFCSVLIACRDDADAKFIFEALTRAGAVIIALALIQYFFEPGSHLLWDRQHYIGSFTATFVNRNTAATFIGIVLVSLVGLIMRRADKSLLGALIHVLGGGKLDGPVQRKLFIVTFDASLLAMCSLGLALTLSRAGTFSTLVAIVLFLLLALPAGNGSGSGRFGRFGTISITLGRAAAGIATLVLVTGLVTGQAQLRAEAGIFADARFCIYPAVWAAIGDNWLFGSGFGAFVQSFAAYQPAECGLDGTWERAHSFYLEGMLGLGILFWPAFLFAIWCLGRCLFIGLVERRRERIYPVIGCSSILLVLLHSSVDFSLQIPGLSLYFATHLAPLLVLSVGRADKIAT